MSDNGDYESHLFDEHIMGDYDQFDEYYPDEDTPVPLEQRENPTFFSILKRRGLRDAINFWAEKKCMVEIMRAHADARDHGYNLIRPTYKPRKRLKFYSKLEWWSRKKLKKSP